MDSGVQLVPIRGNEVGKVIGVSKSTVYNLVDEGELQRVKIGARAFVPMSSIEAYLARITEASA